MKPTISLAQLEQLRRNAKRLARDKCIPLHEAQARIAADCGYRNWSQLVRGGDSAKVPTRVPAASSIDARTRHYLHGDQSETDVAQYFCVMCDQMALAEHFFDGMHDREKSVERYLRSALNFEVWSPAELRNLRRPGNPTNVLSEDVAAYHEARVAKEASRSPFNRWILLQINRDEPIGDLARDVKSDRDFPVSEASLEELIDYLSSQGAVDGAIRAMRDAHAEFLKCGPQVG
ncbi:hypothetical protein PCO31111_04696 [Pandoraea communis]|uniref:YozE SAM-like domain-containing protein n=1 Tax=Pandoraea communis TaxID=2508297 RepID=A0A5E4YQ33_9BURK|nr:YozE family protein [Pandoraea communis]VVE50597.1 hypothetical protein PCO31111_04696 [Pandoraea communis]